MRDDWANRAENLHPDLEEPDLRVQRLDAREVVSMLEEGTVESTHGLLPWSSNYTFLVTVATSSRDTLAVYKPCNGERPLWDFPRGTLCLRECAAYVVSEALGWSFVPPTVLRDGPRGRGAVQLFIHADPNAHYFSLHEEEQYRSDFQRIAAFDAVVNNADRKSGHCLKGKDGRIWAIDHGVTFHYQRKLRTVIWEFAGDPLPTALIADLERFHAELRDDDELTDALSELLSDREMRALRQRTGRLIERERFPQPATDRRSTPWPPV